jgi:hypothetical protein
MTITAAQQAQLEKASTQTLYFVELHFLGGIQYMCTANISVSWNGKVWLGLGTIANISEIKESDDLTAQPMNFTINSADPSWLALAAGAVESYAGRPAKMYRVPLNEQMQIVGEPERCWAGVMDMVSLGVEGENGSITLKCETGAFNLKRGSSLRMNAAQQKQRHPADTGFDRLAGLIASPSLWISKKFQVQ